MVLNGTNAFFVFVNVAQKDSVFDYFIYLCAQNEETVMILELNEVLLKDDRQTLSMMAQSGKLTCLTGGKPLQRYRCLISMMGFEPIVHGYICLDGEPLTSCSALAFRQLMSYAPTRLSAIGEVTVYEPPTIQDVFSLRVNRERPISNGILGEEIRKIEADASDIRVQLLAVAVLLDKPILLVDNPHEDSVEYLKQQAAKGKIVIVTSDNPKVLRASDLVVEL